MYKELNDKEVVEFVLEYLPLWKNDIYKITFITYKNKIEYLINEHYLMIKELT